MLRLYPIKANGAVVFGQDAYPLELRRRFHGGTRWRGHLGTFGYEFA
jgi:hypothetical protein